MTIEARYTQAVRERNEQLLRQVIEKCVMSGHKPENIIFHLITIIYKPNKNLYIVYSI